MSKVKSNVDQKVFNVFCQQVARNAPKINLPGEFTNVQLFKEAATVLGVKPSRRLQRLRGIAKRYSLRTPKCIQLSA